MSSYEYNQKSAPLNKIEFAIAGRRTAKRRKNYLLSNGKWMKMKLLTLQMNNLNIITEVQVIFETCLLARYFSSIEHENIELSRDPFFKKARSPYAHFTDDSQSSNKLPIHAIPQEHCL